MKVQSITNQPNFNGIRLSNSNFNSVKDVAMSLKHSGFDCLGYKKICCNNTNADKVKTAKIIRSKANFYNGEFGVIFFKWSSEAYIMSTPACEQRIYRLVEKYDEGAKINLGV